MVVYYCSFYSSNNPEEKKCHTLFRNHVSIVFPFDVYCKNTNTKKKKSKCQTLGNMLKIPAETRLCCCKVPDEQKITIMETCFVAIANPSMLLLFGLYLPTQRHCHRNQCRYFAKQKSSMGHKLDLNSWTHHG